MSVRFVRSLGQDEGINRNSPASRGSSTRIRKGGRHRTVPLTALPFPATVFTTLRGVSERAWHRTNSNGTKSEFEKHFKDLEPEVRA